MSEPTFGTLTAVVAGITAVVVSLIGVEPQVLFWAFVGGSLGIPVAPKSGRVRATMAFILVVLASSMLGTLVASEYFSGPASTPARAALASKGFSLLIALVFHPLLSVVVSSIPSIWDGLLRKIGLKS